MNADIGMDGSYYVSKNFNFSLFSAICVDQIFQVSTLHWNDGMVTWAFPWNTSFWVQDWKRVTLIGSGGFSFCGDYVAGLSAAGTRPART
jgi:hypothetical protein